MIVVIASYYIIPYPRYNLGSCNSLAPTYVNENWQYPGGGDDITRVR